MPRHSTTLRQSTAQGDAAAHLDLANLYPDWRGMPQDYAEAANWLRKAVDHGNAVAQYNLGFMYTS